MTNLIDARCLQEAFAVARAARANGNHPFGAVLADGQGGVLLRAENTVVTGGDCTGHAETNLMRMATKTFPAARLAACTLYSSTEPCPMCAGAIFWGNVRRVVYGLGQSSLYAMTGDPTLKLPLGCREVLAHGGHPTEVIGPALEDEARSVHVGFW
jgi:tRNA(Arg) A34 adenosine deaminase TadA